MLDQDPAYDQVMVVMGDYHPNHPPDKPGFSPPPLDDNNPYVDLWRFNIFDEKSVPTEEEIIRRVRESIKEARDLYNSALAEQNVVAKREKLERVVLLCERVLGKWRRFSGADTQGDAEQLRDKAKADLEKIKGQTESSS